MKPKLLGVTICFLLRRHRWSKAKAAFTPDGGYEDVSVRVKTCLRCGLERAVKARKAKVAA